MVSSFEPVGQRRNAVFYVGNMKGASFANQDERAPLAVGGQVDILELAPSEASVPMRIRVLEDGEG